MDTRTDVAALTASPTDVRPALSTLKPQPLPEATPQTVSRRITTPGLASGVVERSRLTAVLSGMLHTHQVLAISATAGAGKTTAMVHAAAHLPDPVIWLSLDRGDTDPWRLLTDLETAMATQLDTVRGICAAARPRQATRDVAGLLAEAAHGRPLVVVFDDLERLHDLDPARQVIGGFTRFAPPSLRIVLISRRNIIDDLDEKLPPGFLATIGDTELAISTEEAATVLGRNVEDLADVNRIVDAHGGWITGVLAEARQRPGSAATGPARDLTVFYTKHIMPILDEDEQRFLIATSLLTQVTADAARELGQTDPSSLLAHLAAKPLPVSWSQAGQIMRAHPRFRDYLLGRLAGSAEEGDLRSRYGGLLLQEGRRDEAVQQYIKARQLDRAARSAREAIDGEIDGLRFDVAEQWLELLHTTDAPSTTLSIAEFMVAMGREHSARAAAIGDSLGLLSETAPVDVTSRHETPLDGMLAWAYWQTGRLEDARTILSLRPSDRTVQIAAAILAFSSDAAAPLPVPIAPDGGPYDGMLMRVHYFRGFLHTILSATFSSPWARAMGVSVQASALRASGQLDRALEMFQAAGDDDPGSVWLQVVAGPDLFLDLGRRDDAFAQLQKARELAAERGSIPNTLLTQVAEAKLHLRLDQDAPAAMATLEAMRPQATSYPFVLEIADMWAGYAQLLLGQDEDARRRLTAAVRSMRRGDRMLELPTAAIYLAEAEWRCGREDAADRAADLALTAAARHGSNHILLQALDDVPAVLSRRLDAEPERRSAWHALGRSCRAHSRIRSAGPTHRVVLKDLGQVSLTVDGTAQRPRIGKSLELLAFLRQQPTAEAARSQVLDALFGGRANDSTRSYLRQALYRLREVLPEALAPRTEGNRILLPAPDEVTCDSLTVCALLDQGALLHGEDKLSALRAALELAAAGSYFADSDSEWIVGRRQELADRISAAQLSAAELAYDLGHFVDADDLVEAVLREDEYQEEAWRLSILTANAFGDSQTLVRRYRCYRSAMEQIGVGPSQDVVELFERLHQT
ncbi:BTAD domain-containing putative transcriptional regulator [Mycolicibacterium chlorophenolicum]|uniref:HTH-type transcriptional regulator MalT n=1 Tax=Mycolicibacterium chlorophenolicum TaxID=37916 RepID=A0A0J6VBP3_9MYCO|nr:BTAD domain-containing putative transcriptional regulator [Mycolicibacterium chlorophenolicum]KMO66963.1 HTH-type transcriptional regulator MalT [Mycolicibacterium chlorophenolicum]